jgi:hypothetical protein
MNGKIFCFAQWSAERRRGRVLRPSPKEKLRFPTGQAGRRTIRENGSRIFNQRPHHGRNAKIRTYFKENC